MWPRCGHRRRCLRRVRSCAGWPGVRSFARRCWSRCRCGRHPGSARTLCAGAYLFQGRAPSVRFECEAIAPLAPGVTSFLHDSLAELAGWTFGHLIRRKVLKDVIEGDRRLITAGPSRFSKPRPSEVQGRRSGLSSMMTTCACLQRWKKQSTPWASESLERMFGSCTRCRKPRPKQHDKHTPAPEADRPLFTYYSIRRPQ